MYPRIKLYTSLAILLLTSMCTIYDPRGAVISPNGLICQTRTDIDLMSRKQTAECYYQCPDGTVLQPEIEGGLSEDSPLYSASQEQADAQLCSEVLQPTATEPPATAAAVATQPAVSPPPATPTLETPVVEQPPLLRGDVSMCDVTSDLINFRLVEAAPDLTGKSLEVQIADQSTSCFVNPVNTSLLTCTLPPGVSFPARVVVRLDGATLNDFMYDGVGCATPAP